MPEIAFGVFLCQMCKKMVLLTLSWVWKSRYFFKNPFEDFRKSSFHILKLSANGGIQSCMDHFSHKIVLDFHSECVIHFIIDLNTISSTKLTCILHVHQQVYSSFAINVAIRSLLI